MHWQQMAICIIHKFCINYAFRAVQNIYLNPFSSQNVSIKLYTWRKSNYSISVYFTLLFSKIIGPSFGNVSKPVAVRLYIVIKWLSYRTVSIPMLQPICTLFQYIFCVHSIHALLNDRNINKHTHKRHFYAVLTQIAASARGNDLRH